MLLIQGGPEDWRRAVPNWDELAADTSEGAEERREKAKSYDLRGMVATASVAPIDGGTRITCRMRASQENMARPEQLVAALFPALEGQDY